MLLKGGRPHLETVIQQAKMRDVPVHTMIRLGRNRTEAIRKTSEEDASDLIVLGWSGDTETAGRLYGSVIDPLVDDPPSDVIVVRYRRYRPLRSILIPVSGGANSQRAVRIAVDMARSGQNEPVRITLLHVVPVGAHEAARVRAEQTFRYMLEGIDYQPLDTCVVEGENIVDAVLREADGFDLIVIGATQEPLFRNLLMGNIADQIAQRAKVTVIVVKRRSPLLHSFLRQTVLEPSGNPTPE